MDESVKEISMTALMVDVLIHFSQYQSPHDFCGNDDVETAIERLYTLGMLKDSEVLHDVHIVTERGRDMIEAWLVTPYPTGEKYCQNYKGNFDKNSKGEIVAPEYDRS